MKTIINRGISKDAYPVLVESTKEGAKELVILLVKPNTGFVVVSGDSGYSVGHYSNLWSMYTLERLDGSITIKND